MYSTMMRLAACLAVLAVSAATAGAASAAVIRVPQDAATLPIALGRVHPGDTILLDRGRYPGGYVIPAAKHDLTIRGVDRNGVVLDGANRRKNGIIVRAGGVSLLNMSAHGFLENAFYWKDADRYRGSYLTAWNVRGYGIYAEDSVGGVLYHDYVSGAADAAYYIGECRPCRATVAHVVARLSAVGYSGTNSTGVVIRDSLWDRNGVGIVPNSYANEALPPAGRNTIVRNSVVDSGRAAVPIHTALAGFVGAGIAIAGTSDSTISANRVLRSERYGIAVFSTARFVTFDPQVTRDPEPRWQSVGNHIFRNVVSGSGRADLALAPGTGRANCFAQNRVGTTLPPTFPQPSCPVGDSAVAADLEAPLQAMVREVLQLRRPPSYRTMPAPPPQPNIP